MPNSFNAKQQFQVDQQAYNYFDLNKAEEAGLAGIKRLPYSLKVLLENLLRFEDDNTVKATHIQAFVDWLSHKTSQQEIAYRPTRVLLQDFTGVPAIVDLATMRDTLADLKGNPDDINPLCNVDLVIDHSVQVDRFADMADTTVKKHTDSNTFIVKNVAIEMQRNRERYTFLKWGQQAFDNFRVVPPGTGICHQVNLEYLAKSVWTEQQQDGLMAYPDTLVGTDSHTTMINALGVLGWGVGGIEAEAAMLGQPISMLIPEVIGVRLVGELRAGITATDLVLTITERLRQKGVVAKFVEYFGRGLKHLTLADRATIANMAPEYGATCGFFPIDEETLRYLKLTGRDEQNIQLVEAYAKQQGLWHDETQEAIYTDIVEIDLSAVETSLAGPKRPQDRVNLATLPQATEQAIKDAGKGTELDKTFDTSNQLTLRHGDVVIAAITSCTNTSNPDVMLAAGLLAKNAVEQGLVVKPWVKTSLAPGSKVVRDYLEAAGLLPYLEKLGFYLVGYGCTTCIGNSGPLAEPIAETINRNNLVMSGVLSGNRNFEGRIHPHVKANWLASPPLVVAFALAGTTRIDLHNEPIGENAKGNAIYLKDIWPDAKTIDSALNEVKQQSFTKEYDAVFDGDDSWQQIEITKQPTYAWQAQSTYVKKPPFFNNQKTESVDRIENARVLALLGDSVTTDHISPAGAIKPDSPAGNYLQENGVSISDFNSYGSRRGNHEVMMRGTFANIRIRNEMLSGVEGGFTRHYPSGDQLAIYDAAMRYQTDQIPLVVIAGKEYGTGSSRDWAAKGTLLLGVKAVIAESFERIHRSNLIGMGVLPLEFTNGETRKTLALTGEETVTITGLDKLEPQGELIADITRADGSNTIVSLRCRIDTDNELAYYQNGGILPYVLKKML